MAMGQSARAERRGREWRPLMAGRRCETRSLGAELRSDEVM